MGVTTKFESGVVDTERATGATVAAAAAGDRAAWELLVDSYTALVWNIARSYRLSDADAGDVSQTVWLRLLENISAIRNPEHVAAWLVTTTRREALRVLAINRRLVPSSAAMDLELPDTTLPPPDARLIADEERRMTRRAVATLPPRWQQLVYLLASDLDLSYAEVADRLGLPIGSIGPTRGRCLRRLRAVLERPGG